MRVAHTKDHGLVDVDEASRRRVASGWVVTVFHECRNPTRWEEPEENLQYVDGNEEARRAFRAMEDHERVDFLRYVVDNYGPALVTAGIDRAQTIKNREAHHETTAAV